MSQNTANVYSMNIKSATSTMGSVTRSDAHSLQMMTQDDLLKKQAHGSDATRQQHQQAVTMQKEQEGLTISSNLQRSMHFRRRASKEMRANSAKWTKNTSTIKN